MTGEASISVLLALALLAVQNTEQRAQFCIGFGQFLPGVGVGNNAGAGLQFNVLALNQRRAQGDGKFAIAAAIE